MKRVIASVIVTAVGLVMLLGFKTHRVQPDAQPALPTTEPTITRSTTNAASGTGGTYTGISATTRYGPVQVQITIAGSALTKVNVIDYPRSSSRDVSINKRAIPLLTAQALQAQSANIDGVSGASYTTDGFIHSLQSALDQAQR